jgi:hypothetical protein
MDEGSYKLGQQEQLLKSNGYMLKEQNENLKELIRSSDDQTKVLTELSNFFTQGNFDKKLEDKIADRHVCARDLKADTTIVANTVSKLCDKIQWVILPLIGIVGTSLTVILWLGIKIFGSPGK